MPEQVLFEAPVRTEVLVQVGDYIYQAGQNNFTAIASPLVNPMADNRVIGIVVSSVTTDVHVRLINKLSVSEESYILPGAIISIPQRYIHRKEIDGKVMDWEERWHSR